MENPQGKWSSNALKLENAIWAIRLLLICVGIGSCVALLKTSVIPYASTFIVHIVPCIWNRGRILFSPPYIYIIVNCIIMAIVASNSYHHHLGRKPEAAPSSLYLQKTELLETKITEKDEAMVEETIEVIKPMIAESEIESNNSSRRPDRDPSDPPIRAAEEESGKNSPESEDSNLPDEQEGDTLDSIWKAITEGQGKQPVGQLKKSDTWETATRRALNEAEPGAYDERAFRKSETFRERTAAVPKTVIVDREVAKEKSMGLDELNQRIEAFIRKNRDDMRLQREESARQLVEMVNGGIVLLRRR